MHLIGHQLTSFLFWKSAKNHFWVKYIKSGYAEMRVITKNSKGQEKKGTVVLKGLYHHHHHYVTAFVGPKYQNFQLCFFDKFFVLFILGFFFSLLIDQCNMAAPPCPLKFPFLVDSHPSPIPLIHLI